jgi:hypothetical protein
MTENNTKYVKTNFPMDEANMPNYVKDYPTDKWPRELVKAASDWIEKHVTIVHPPVEDTVTVTTSEGTVMTHPNLDTETKDPIVEFDDTPFEIEAKADVKLLKYGIKAKIRPILLTEISTYAKSNHNLCYGLGKLRTTIVQKLGKDLMGHGHTKLVKMTVACKCAQDRFFKKHPNTLAGPEVMFEFTEIEYTEISEADLTRALNATTEADNVLAPIEPTNA